MAYNVLDETADTIRVDRGDGKPPLVINKSAVSPAVLESVKSGAGPVASGIIPSIAGGGSFAGLGRAPSIATPPISDVNVEIDPVRSPAVSPEIAPPLSPPVAPVAPIIPNEIPKSAQNDLDRGAGLMRKGLQEAQRVGMEKATAEEAYAKEAERISAERFAKAAAERDAQMEAMKVAQEKAQAADQAMAGFKFQDYWAKPESGSKILAAIAVGLGAYAGSMDKSGRNDAKEIIDSAINKDMDLQKANYEKLQGDGKVANNAYARLMDVYKDKNIVDTAFQAQALEQVKNQLNTKIAGLGSADAKAKGMQAIGELDLKIGQLKQEQLAKSAAASGKNASNLIPALGIYATTSEGASKINELAGATKAAQNGIGDLLAMSKKTGRSLSLEDRARAETTASLVKAALRVPILGPGTVNEGERALMDKIVANPTAIFSLDNTTKTRLETLAKRLDNNLQTQAAAYALPGQTLGQRIPSDVGGGLRKVRLKDGRVGNIPESKLAEALKLGAEVIQ